MNRLERVREEVDSILQRLVSDEDRRCGFIHLYGVSLTATWLAERRGLDTELAAVAGMLHDLATYATGDSTNHAAASARLASRTLEQSGLFSKDEIEVITHAIARHSDKAAVDGPMGELLKDADVAQHWLYNPSLAPQASHADRRIRLRKELTHYAELRFTAERAEDAEVAEERR
jgi:HD superfamily phosphodiesterase